MAGYVRQSTITNGLVVEASLFTAEYDAIVAAMHATTGHAHDGTAGEGPILITAALTSGTVNGAVIGGVTPAAITGTLITADTNFVGDITGNVTGNCSGSAATATSATSATTAGTVTTAAQPNITSVGTLATLTVTADIVGNVTGTAVTVTGAAQAAITSVGILTSLQVDNININAAVITSNTGLISFGNENLSTTGTLTAANINVNGGNLVPLSDGASNLGSTANGWAEVHIASGGQILFDDPDLGFTHSAGLLKYTGGDFEFGTYSATGVTYGFHVDFSADALIKGSVTTTSNASMYAFANPNGVVGTINTSGTATSYNTSSDPRLKSSFNTILGAMDMIVEAQEEGIIGQFTFLSDPNTLVWGYNAHKLIDLQPGFGGTEGEGNRSGRLGSEFKVNVGNGKTKRKTITPAGVDQSKRVPMLEAAIYELYKEIEDLKKS